MAALAKCLRVAHGRFQLRIGGFRHQAMADRHEMFSDDAKVGFGQKKMDVRHAAVQ